MQTKHLTKSEYFKQNKIPIVTVCRKLESELPVMTHLIQALPSLVPEIEKIHSKKTDNHRTNLELANALKIIHELEFELETMASRFNETEEELLLHENHIKELSRQIQRNEEIIISLESTIQKNEFSAKAKLEFEKEYNSNLLIQYEKRIEDMNTAYDQLRNEKERELKDTKNFHEENISKVETRVREFENEAKEDTKKLEKELEKAILLNIEFRQKLADLEIFNQEHVYKLEKTNTELLQMNMRLKTEYEHKLQVIETSFELSENKARELVNTIKILENRLENEENAWKDEKKCIIEQNLENERIWKNSYNEISKQKDRVLQELNKKTILLGEKEREEGNLNEKIKSLDRFVGELSQEKIKILEDNERSKKELAQNLLLDHHLKIDEIKFSNERFISQEMKRALDAERRSLEERYATEVAKYVEQIRILETQKLEDSHSVRLSEDCSRKLQVKIDQMKIEIDFLNKHSQEYSESFQNKAKIMDEEYLYKLNNEQKRYSNDIEKLRSENELEEQRIKERFEQNIRELNKMVEQKSNEIREAQNKCKQLNNDYANERANFILRIQELELNMDKYQTHNQNLVKLNQNLTEKVISLEDQCRSEETTAHEQINNRIRIAQELNAEIENVQTLRAYIDQKERESLSIVGNLKAEIFDKRRIIERYEDESERLETTISDLKFRLENLERENKTIQEEKERLQRKLIERDTSSEENWRILEADQKEKVRKMNTEFQIRESDFKSIIKQKELIIEKQISVIKDLQEDIVCEKNKNEHLSVTWQIKCREFEEANRKLLKSSFTLQDLEKENNGKDMALNNLLKDVERYRNENEEKKKTLTFLQNENFDFKCEINKINFENERLRNSINQLENKNKSLEDEFETHKERMSREFAQFKESEVSKILELQKLERDLKELKAQLEEISEISQKAEFEKIKALENTKTLQGELELIEQELKSYKKESIQEISELTATKLELEQKLRQTGEELNEEVNEQETTNEKNKEELERFSRILKQYENEILENLKELETAHRNLEQEKISSSFIKAEMEELMKEKIFCEQKIESFMNEIECLKKEKVTFERQLNEVYEENDKKLQQKDEELEKHYNDLLRQKAENVEDMSVRFSELSEKERSEWESRYQESHLEKEEFLRELSLKKEQFTCLRIEFENLKLELEQKNRELSLYKSKWALIFGNVKEANDSIENSVKHEKELNNENIRMKRLETRSEMERTERSERTYKTSYGANHSPENYFKKARESTSFEKNRYEREFVNDFNENEKVDDSKQEVDLTKNEAVIFSKLTFNKEKEQKNGQMEEKENSSINSNCYASNRFDL